MKRSELEGLGLTKEQVDQIMEAHGKTVNETKAQLEAAQKLIDDVKGQSTKLQAEFEDFKKSKMTEEEKRQHEAKEHEAERVKVLEAAKQAEKQYTTLIRKTKVKDFLITGGIEGQDADKFVDSLVGDTEESSIEKAKAFVDFVKVQKETAAAKALEKATKGTPPPAGGNPPPPKETFKPDIVW